MMKRKENVELVYAENGKDFQEYYDENNKRILEGTPVGVEITKKGKTKFYILDGVYY